MGGIFERIEGSPAQRRGQMIARVLLVIATMLLLAQLYLMFIVHDTRRYALSFAISGCIIASSVITMRSTPKQAR